ncbi:MAG: hypothetical protein BWX61_01478 [Bacteroidetes bacterium ADurb.Bin035]|nr:MAG: hypothetical protein BWX61_01478 [Bacteroidetes bacterium ADurb.Bin035]
MLKKIGIALSIISILLIGIYLIKWHKQHYINVKNITSTVDTVYVEAVKVVPQIKYVKIPITQTINDTIIIKDSLSYEIAVLDTTFQLEDKGWHKLHLEYDEYYNLFDINSQYSINSTQIITENPQKEQLKKLIKLGYGYNWQSKQPVLDLGIGLRYKALGLGIEADTNNKLGLFLQMEFK